MPEDAARVTLTTAPSLVVCAGIPRSGSTWLYNAVRLLLAQDAGDAGVHGSWIDQYDPAHSARWHVVKINEADESLAWRASTVLTSRRDLRDIAASAWKRGWIGDHATAVGLLDSVVSQHVFWSSRCAFEMVYERMRRDPAGELRMIARILHLTSSDDVISRTLVRIDALGHDDASDSAFDSANLMHKRHIMDGRVGYFAEALPADVLATINQRYAGWLGAHGYAVG